MNPESNQPETLPHLRGGFAKGTLVHTKEGPVPIEQIKVGDWVLSRPENTAHGAELAYKRVLKTFVHQDKEVLLVEVQNDPVWKHGKSKNITLFCTLDCPFWTENEGWVSAQNLSSGYMNKEWKPLSKASLMNGSLAYPSPSRVYGTGKEGVGWHGAGFDGHGGLWDFDQCDWINPYIYFGEPYEDLTWPWDEMGDVDGEGYNYRGTVYNLEVEDCHTYFVGEWGVWCRSQLLTPV